MRFTSECRLALVVGRDVGEGGVVVVGEEDEPAFGDGAGVEAFTLGDAGDGIEIVAHDPGDVEMGAGGDEVGDVAGMLARGLNVDGEELRGVAREALDGNAGDDGGGFAGLRVEKGHLAGGDEGIVVIGDVADGIALELEMAVGDFTAMGEVAGVGESGGDAAVRSAGRVPTAMVEVKMGINDDVDFFGADAARRRRRGATALWRHRLRVICH